MYYQNYEDYMRQVLGYPINDPNIYESYDYRNMQTYEDTYSSRNQVTPNLSNSEIKSWYPEIYNLVYPMVCKVCETNTQPITRDLIEKMTDEVYFATNDTSTVVNIRVDTPKPEGTRSNDSKTPKSKEDRNSNIASTNSERRKLTPINSNQKEKSINENSIGSNTSYKPENRQVVPNNENRQSNSTLRDLIKILILYRLFGNRPQNPRPPRPPYPGNQGRPPFPGGRPPIRPGDIALDRQQMDYTNYLDF